MANPNPVILVACCGNYSSNINANEIQRVWPTKRGKTFIKLVGGEIIETEEDYAAFVTKWKGAF